MLIVRHCIAPRHRTTCAGMTGWAAERTDGPAEGGGLHPQGRNASEGPRRSRGCGTPRRDHRKATPPGMIQVVRGERPGIDLSFEATGVRKVGQRSGRAGTRFRRSGRLRLGQAQGREPGSSAVLRRLGIQAPKLADMTGDTFLTPDDDRRCHLAESRADPLARSRDIPMLSAGDHSDAERVKP